MLNYHVIQSGSSGNAVLIEDVLIDCGVAFSRLKEYLYDVKYLIITHIHSDHLKKSTFNKLRSNFPHIIVIGNWQVSEHVLVDHIINAGFPLELDDYTFNAFECLHDVVTYGFYWKVKDSQIIYATDTANMDNAPKRMQFDYFFLESNHDEEKVELIRNQRSKYKYDAYQSALRHLSKQKSKEFYYLNRRTRDAKHIELHKSQRFY